MVIALLAVLGVNLIVIVVLLAGVVTRKRWVMRRPGLFRAVAREASGEVRGLHPKWRRGYGRWVHDILVWTKGPFFFSNELLPADGTTEECPAAPGEVKRLGVEPGRPHPPIGSGERRGRGERSRPHPPPRGLRGTGRPGGRVRHPPRRTTMAAALTLGGVVLLGACGSGGSSPDAGPTRTASRPGSSPSLARPTEARTSASAGVPTHSAAGPTNPAPTAARTTTIPPKPTSASEPVEASTVTSSVSVSGSKEVAVTEQDTSQVTDWWPVALLAVLVLLVLGVWARIDVPGAPAGTPISVCRVPSAGGRSPRWLPPSSTAPCPSTWSLRSGRRASNGWTGCTSHSSSSGQQHPPPSGGPGPVR